MAVRNFWIEANVDGRKTKLTGGPRSKDGGLALDIFMRSDGASEKVVHIEGFVDSMGILRLYVMGVDMDNYLSYSICRFR